MSGNVVSIISGFTRRQAREDKAILNEGFFRTVSPGNDVFWTRPLSRLAMVGAEESWRYGFHRGEDRFSSPKKMKSGWDQLNPCEEVY